MIPKRLICIMAALLLLTACQNSSPGFTKTALNRPWLDSIFSHSDTVYHKKYRTPEFAVAGYAVNTKTGTLCQVMYGPDSSVRQIIMTIKNKPVLSQSFFANGQLSISYPFNRDGLYEGDGIFYHENGAVRYAGRFANGLYTGLWKNYDTTGRLSSMDEYDSLGQFIRIVRK